MVMKFIKTIFIFTAVVGAVSCVKEDFSGSSPAESGKYEAPQGYLPGQVVLKFDESLSPLLDESGISSAPATRSGVSSVDELLEAVKGYRLERVFPATKDNEERSREAGLHLWYVVHFSEDENVDDVVKKLSVLGEVQAAAPVRTIKKAYNGKVIPFSTGIATKTGENVGDLIDWQWNLRNNGASKYDKNQEVTGEGALEGYPFDGRTAESKFTAGRDIHWDKARAICQGDESIIVAVLDEAICLDHYDLRNSLWTNEDEIEYSLEDNDGNGYEGDVHGYDFINNRGNVTWDSNGDSGHGTHVAGIIAAENGNNGISSIAGGTATVPGVRLMSCQIFSGSLSSSTVSLARAIKYATDNGAVVLQCSFGYTSGAANPYEYGTGYRTDEEWEVNSPLEKAAMDYFIHYAGSDTGPVKGGIPVFASGNEYAPMAGYPGAYEGCVSVASVAADFTPATYTNYGPGTTLAAPGGDQDYYFDFKEDTDTGFGDTRGAVGCILSTVPSHISESGYGYMEGTSMACPHVSGVVALGLSYAAQQHRHFTAEEFINLLKQSCTVIDGDDDSNNFLQGDKFYYKWQADASFLIHGRRMELSSYRGKMGAGVVNAEALLNLIKDGGVAMQFPNIFVNTGSTMVADPFAYMDGDSFSVEIEDVTVAAVSSGSGSGAGSVNNVTGTLTFHGLKNGSTTATITSSTGSSQEFAITVRKTGSGSDWL